ncbi:hypothetical protein F0562_019316 [Nyssa sinensis]|uniref:Late embryogenesis abundant protein LEA-2 subgroup domain-containing protein n=1 Tax=Nyssa sinensis TaxID=561372 RepID=A0A5J4ZFY9_9ASTE|nr:hypothetical protein F0562_019316 [Nyssa sinensis]
MNEQMQPVLRKPPGYRDPSALGQTPTRLLTRSRGFPLPYRPEKKRRSCCWLFCCFICIAILVLLFIIIVSGGVFYIWFEPRLPIFHLKSFQFIRFNVTVNPDGTYLNSQTVIRVEVRNAKLEVEVMNELVEDGVVKKLKDGFRSKSLVVSAEIQSGIGLRSGGWDTNTVGIKVLCGHVNLKHGRGWCHAQMLHQYAQMNQTLKASRAKQSLSPSLRIPYCNQRIIRGGFFRSL